MVATYFIGYGEDLKPLEQSLTCDERQDTDS